MFWGVGGDFECQFARVFAEVFETEFWGCNSHFAGNVRKNGGNKSYKKDVFQREWEHSLRNVCCLPPEEIEDKVIFICLIKNFEVLILYHVWENITSVTHNNLFYFFQRNKFIPHENKIINVYGT